MKAVTFHGKEDVRVEDVPDPSVQEPTDAIIRVTSAAICGSDLHLYDVLGMFIDEGDILGHEAMGIVEDVGPAVTNLHQGDRVVIPFNIACGDCWTCRKKLFSQCETTQVREQQKGAALFGYTRLYGSVPGGQAEYLRVPQAHFGAIKVPVDGPDERYLFLSDVLPTAWQAVEYAGVSESGSPADSRVENIETFGVIGLGPIGQMASRIALHRGVDRVLAFDVVPERVEMARRWGVDAYTLEEAGGTPAFVKDATDGRGADAVIDAVGMEAHGDALGSFGQAAANLLPDALARTITEHAALDRMAALHDAIDAVRRGGTVSIIGVYGGKVDPFPMMDLFDKQVQLRMGQANVHAWTDRLLELVQDDEDPLGVLDFTSHVHPLEEAPIAYRRFKEKSDGYFKVVLKP